jgi:hypothetical protein
VRGEMERRWEEEEEGGEGCGRVYMWYWWCVCVCACVCMCVCLGGCVREEGRKHSYGIPLPAPYHICPTPCLRGGDGGEM